MQSYSEFEDFVCPAANAVDLKFVSHEKDFDDNSTVFHPDYTHQVFGENEVIFGYKKLQVKLYYTPGHLNTFIGINYAGKIDPKKHEGLKADGILETLAELVEGGFTTNQDEFLAKLPDEAKFHPYGELLEAYRKDDVQYEIYKIETVTPGFASYHSRLQVFLLWFVDASSFLDIDDDKWNFYMLYEKHIENGQPFYSIVGYLTLYNYYAYPDKIRPRISQALIFPPYQRQHHGTKLLNAVYNDLIVQKDVYDITVEDPSDGFVALRDMLDCQNCQTLPKFQPPMIHQAFTNATATAAREKFKINKKQCQRVYEILRLRATDRNNTEQYKNYRLTVKNRLNAPFQKEKKDLEKLKHFVGSNELTDVSTKLSNEERMAKLQEAYKQLEQDYQAVIEKLATL
ncbi:histone acetyltransferase type B catalytic subunit-like isoform X2 [Dysidea avara]